MSSDLSFSHHYVKNKIQRLPQFCWWKHWRGQMKNLRLVHKPSASNSNVYFLEPWWASPNEHDLTSSVCRPDHDFFQLFVHIWCTFGGTTVAIWVAFFFTEGSWSPCGLLMLKPIQLNVCDCFLWHNVHVINIWSSCPVNVVHCAAYWLADELRMYANWI